MFKNATRILGLFLALLISVGAITACSSDKPDKKMQELGIQAQGNLKPVTLVFRLEGEEKPNTGDVLKEIERRTHDMLNVKLDFDYVHENYQGEYGMYERVVCNEGGLATLSYIGEPKVDDSKYDGFYLHKYKYRPEFEFSNFAWKGYLKDISKLLPEYAPGIYKKLSKEQLAAVTVDGKIFAVPNLFPRQDDLYAIVRQDLMEKYKVPEIKTYKDYEAYLKIVKENEGIMSPSIIRIRENSLKLFARALGYEILNEDLQLVYKRDDPDMKVLAWEKTPGFDQAVNYLSDWKRKGYMSWGNISEAYTDKLLAVKELKDQLLSGAAASTITPDNFTEDLNSQLNLLGKKNWSFKAYKLSTGMEQRWTSPADGCIAFRAGSKNVERALMFLDWLQSSQENYDLLMYGREKVDYSLEGENYKLTEGFNSEYECPYLGWQSSNAFKNLDFERFPAGTPESVKDEYIRSARKALYPPHMGFYPDYARISTEVRQRIYYLDLLIDSPILNGTYSKESMDPDLSGMADEAAKAVITSVQGQLEKWKENGK